MNSNRLACSPFKFLVVLGAIVLIPLQCPIPASAQEEAVLAQVGPYKLTVEAFEKQVASMPPQLQMMLLQNPQMKEQFLDRWVQITLLAQEAKNRKLDQDPEFLARLEDIRNSLLAQELMQREMEEKGQVSEEETKAYYDGNKQEFTEPEQVKARHILVKVPPESDEKTWTAAEEKAKDIKKKLESGSDFAEMAKEYSDDPGSKGRGGELNFFPRGRMVPEFETVAFAMKPGELSEPVKTQFGYHIIQVQEKKAPSEKAFDDSKDQIRNKLQGEKQQKILTELTEKLKAQYPVTINKELLSTAE